MAAPTFQLFHTLRHGDAPFKLYLDPEGDYMGVIFERGPHFEIYSHLSGQPWMSTVIAPPAREAYGRLKSFIWHPFLPRQFLLIYAFVVQNAVFVDLEGVEIMDTWHVDPALNDLVHGITNPCINEAASELTFFIENSLFTLRDPFSTDFHGSEQYRPVPNRLHVDTGHESLALWYINDDLVVGVYPLGFFATSTVSPHNRVWQITVLPARMIYSACISPDKELSVAITKDGQADLYCLMNHQFLRTFASNYGPYRSIATAAFSSRRAVVLECCSASVLVIIPDLLKSDLSLISFKRLGANDVPSEAPLAIFGSGLIAGDGYVFTFKGGNAPICMINVEECFGFERGRFEVDTWHEWIDQDCPPHIPMINLNAPMPVPVAVTAAAPPLHPIKALARDIIQSVNWQHLVAAAIIVAGFVTGIINPEA